MAGIFPASVDGGLPPNPALPLNPSHAYAPQWFPPSNTSALYYGNGCDVRLRPEVINSLISELEAVADRGEVAYSSTRLVNVELAVRYMIQRGLPRGGITSGSTSFYAMTLDPPAARYNDYMTLTAVPHATNTTVVRMNVNGLGNVPVLRNDGQELQAGDWRALRPAIIAYYGGAFYVCSLVPSQLPTSLLPQSDIDGWIRTDGDDSHDGTANTPDKAFRTIQGAWNKISSTYVASPVFAVNLRLGIPGTYDGAAFANFGGSIRLFGDQANPAAYIIRNIAPRPGTNFVFCIANTASNLYIRGVTFENGSMPPSVPLGLQLVGNSNTQIHDCNFNLSVANPGCVFISMASGAVLGHMGVLNFNANNNTMRAVWFSGSNATFGTQAMEIPVTLNFTNITVNDAFMVASWLSTCWMPATTMAPVNCHGKKYSVENGSMVQGSIFGASWPGDVAGTVSTNGLFF
jgi:hypothetical protein